MKHKFHFTTAPVNPEDRVFPDGAITGNGDLSVMWGGEPDRLRLHISKCDFWHAIPGDKGGGGISPVGWIEIGMPLAYGSDYDVVQDMDKCEVVGHFAAAHTKATVRSVACAVDNIILLEVGVTRPGTSVDVFLTPYEGNNSINTNERIGDIQVVTRKFDDERSQFVSEACMACKEVSRTHRTGDDGRETELIRYAVSVVTNHDNGSCRRQALQKAIAIYDDDFDELLKRHAEWWSDFWAKSSMSIPGDEEIENNWYAGLYIMAICARNKKFPPGLWGNFCLRDDLPWQSDYHLNYNYQAPYWGLPSANHIELMDSFDTPLEDFMPFARTYAQKFLGCRGVYFPVGIGPMGLDTSCIPGSKEHGILFLGQKTDAAYSASVIAKRWFATRDTKYAKEHGYQYLKEVAEFWEDYLVYENGSYKIYNDAGGEVDYYSVPEVPPTGNDNVNPVPSLILVELAFRCLLDMRAAIGVDEDRAEKWEHIVNHLPHPISDPMFILIWDMYPSDKGRRCMDERFMKAVFNACDNANCWVDDNFFCLLYPTAARTGVSPDKLTNGMHMMLTERGLGNGLFRCYGGGIENNSAIVNTIDEMVLQSFDGVMRFYPDWNLSKPIKYTNLRANGAFLVSSELMDGEFSASVYSEKGSALSIEKPAFGKYCLIQNGQRTPFGDEDRAVITVRTSVGETIRIEAVDSNI